MVCSNHNLHIPILVEISESLLLLLCIGNSQSGRAVVGVIPAILEDLDHIVHEFIKENLLLPVLIGVIESGPAGPLKGQVCSPDQLVRIRVRVGTFPGPYQAPVMSRETVWTLDQEVT